MADVEFGLLGPVEVRHDGRVLPLGGMRPRAVLALLLLADGAPVSEQRLVDALWGEEPPRQRAQQPAEPRLPAAVGAGPGRCAAWSGAGRVTGSRSGPASWTCTAPERGPSRHATRCSRRRAARLISRGARAVARPRPRGVRGPAGLEASGLAADRVRLEELHRTLRDELLDARLAAGEHARLLPDLRGSGRRRPAARAPAPDARGRAVPLRPRPGRRADAAPLPRTARRRDRAGPDRRAGRARVRTARRRPGAAPAHGRRVAPAAPRPALLAAPANPFFGRAAEREALQAAIRAQRLVTVTGPGGVGKTRLVLELLADAADPVVLLDLAALHDGTDVLAALATALGVRPSGARPLAEAVLDALREQRLLLVLDNCEHVTAAVVELVTAVLRHAPAVTVLATSRSRLGLAEEQVVPLGPLPVPAANGAAPFAAVAVQLFTDRARRVRPSFALTAADAGGSGRSAAASTACRWHSSWRRAWSQPWTWRRCSRGWTPSWS